MSLHRSSSSNAIPTHARRASDELKHPSLALRACVESVFLVPKLRLGTDFRETLFRGCPPGSGREARNGVSRTAFPNRVWERESLGCQRGAKPPVAGVPGLC